MRSSTTKIETEIWYPVDIHEDIFAFRIASKTIVSSYYERHDHLQS